MYSVQQLERYVHSHPATTVGPHTPPLPESVTHLIMQK